MSRKSLPKTALTVPMRICLLLGVLVAALLAIGIEKRSVYPGEEILWSGHRGIYETGGRSGHPVLYLLRDRKGTIIGSPVFARWRDSLVYWSPADNAVCILAPNGSQRWTTVTELPAENWRTVSIEATSHTIFMNLEEESHPSVGADVARPSTQVLAVNPITGVSRLLIGARWVDAAAGSDAFADLAEDGNVEVTAGHKHWLGLRAVTDHKWAYDCINDCGAVQKSCLEFDGPSGQIQWRSWVANSEMGLTLQPRVRQVWCQSHELFRYRSRLVIWSYSGRELAAASYPLELGRAVMVADNRIDRVLRTLGPGE